MELRDKFLHSGIEALKNLAEYAGKDEVEKARLVRVLENKSDVLHAYEMGVDYRLNGASELNCHFSIFTTVEGVEAWEKGKGGHRADSV